MVHQGVIAVARVLAALALAAFTACALPGSVPEELPPPAPREARAAWVASVAHIDWPSRAGLSAAEQQQEIRAIVERAAAMRLNMLIVQVRPAADALYPSSLEPWSEYLTGEQGRPPDPPWDPLAMWIEESHKRGIELHAWVNPYRARHSLARSPEAPSHVARTSPAIVKAYGKFLWMDPGEPEAARRTLAVIADIVRRYDVDGMHVDDYFYPYPEKVPGTDTEIDFPDEPSWNAYRGRGGTLARADWRRRNVDDLVRAMNETVHREKPWVRFGVSPFGLGRPEFRPAGVVGFSQYDKLYADVEGWIAHAWFDYLAPQLYWKVDAPGQPFEPLLDYWPRDNPGGRHVWPGFFTSRINDTPASWEPAEITRQIAIARTRATIGGHIHFSMAALMQDRKGIATRLTAEEYAQPALVPATPWLGKSAPLPPRASVRQARDGWEVAIDAAPGTGDAAAWLHTVWTRQGREWRFHTMPAMSTALRLPGDTRRAPDAVFVSSVNRLGVESARVRAMVEQ